MHVCFGFPPLPQIYGGGGHTCEIDAYGETWCCGENRFGQLGDGSFEARTKPVKVAGGHQFVDLALGAHHTCGLTADGSAYCWGSNGSSPGGGGGYSPENGALGDGTETLTQRPDPGPWGPLLQADQRRPGLTCGVTAGSDAFCWGYNGDGELGDGSLDNRLVPTRVQGGGFEEIGASEFNTCGLSGGRAYCWGKPLGSGSPYTPKPEDSMPHQIGGSYPSLQASPSAMAGLRAEPAGAAYCWGDNAYGRLGDGPAELFSAESPVAVVGGHTFGESPPVSGTSAAWRGGGRCSAGDTDNFGPLGQGTSDLNDHPTPGRSSAATSSGPGRVGAGHSCGIDSGGFAWCWGFNAQGQLGVGVAGLEESRYKPNTVLFPGVS